MNWRPPRLLPVCLMLSLPAILPPVPSRAQESRPGELAGTWCARCNRLIPAGQSCPHMDGGGGPSPGESLRVQRIEEYNAFYVEPFNAGVELQKAALATRDPAAATSLYQQAIAQFQKALEFRPESEAARRAIASCQASIHCCAGQAAVQRGDRRGAIDHFCLAQRTHPGGARIWSGNVAWALATEREHCIRTVDGKALVPEPGYRWVTSNPGDFRVSHIPGYPHPSYPNVVWIGEGEMMRPAPGYRWVDPGDEKNTSTEPIPAGELGPYPGTVWGGDGRSLRPAPGYAWAKPQEPHDLRVVPAARGSPVPGHPNLIASGDGRVGPAAGYVWARPGDRANLEVRLAGSESATLAALKAGLSDPLPLSTAPPRPADFAPPRGLAQDREILACLERRMKALATLEGLRLQWTRVAQEASDLDLSPKENDRVAAAALKYEATFLEDRMKAAQEEIRAAAAGMEDRARRLESQAWGGSARDATASALPLKK